MKYIVVTGKDELEAREVFYIAKQDRSTVFAFAKGVGGEHFIPREVWDIYSTGVVYVENASKNCRLGNWNKVWEFSKKASIKFFSFDGKLRDIKFNC